MVRVLAPLLGGLLAGCSPEFDRLLVVARTGDDYAVRGRRVPELDDARRLVGTLGRGWRGGRLDVDGYREGVALDIEYVVPCDTAIAAHEDGLILWSFYAHLADARADLEASGHDLSPIFPIDAAYSPVSVLDFAGFENAAYSPPAHIFVLFPDLVQRGVPLAANAGVVRHELAHAWFELVVNDLAGDNPYDEDTQTSLGVRSVNEGWADTVATLSLDDPRFLEASLPMTSRDVTRDWFATEALYPFDDPGLFEVIGYDPYRLGTVFAALAWDLRLEADPDTVLTWASVALAAWAAEEAWDDLDRYAVLLVEQAHPTLGQAACAAFATRFPDDAVPDVCR